MFSLFRKKDKVYSCLGVIVQPKMSDEDFESCLDFFARGLKPKVFTSNELEIISNKLGFDVKDYYFFVDNADLEKNKYKVSISILYRFKGSKSISDEEVESIINKIDSEIFYNRADIENLSMQYGFSVFDRCIFESYAVNTYSLNNGGNVVQFVMGKQSE